MQYELVNVGTQTAFVEARSTWAADLVHLPHIRALTRQWLGALRFDQDTEQDLVFAVNEAACNAIEHAYPNPRAPAKWLRDLVSVEWTAGVAGVVA